MPLPVILQKSAPARYAAGAAFVVAGLLFRLMLESLVGPGLPPYITFYPAVMLAALIGGFGPGLLATGAASLMVDYWVLPPVHSLKIENRLDAASLLLFAGTGVFMTVVAHLYRRAQAKIREALRQQGDQLENLVASRTENLNQATEELARQVEMQSQANESLRQSQERLHLALESANAGFWEWDLATQEIYWSDELWTVFGRKRNSCTPSFEAWLETIHPEDRQRAARMVQEAVAKGMEVTCEWRAVAPAEQPRWLLSRGCMVADAEGKRVRYFGIVVDVTARHQAEEQQRLAQELFTAAFANNPAGIVLTLLDAGTVLDVNDTWTAMTGYGREEVLGRSARHMWPTAEDARRFVDELKAKGRLPLWEQEFRHKSGGTYVTQMSAQVLDLRGEKLILSTLVDITERKRAELSLREREEQLRLFIEHSPAAIAMLDDQMRYLAVSRQWLVDYHLAGQELRGRSHYEIFSDIPARWKEIHHRCLAGAVERMDEDSFERGDGIKQWLRWEIRPWHLASGAVGGIIIFTEDITARKRAEAETDRMRVLLVEGQSIAHVGSWEYIVATQDTVWSAEQLRIYGLDPAGPSPAYAEMLRKHIHPEDATLLDETFRRCFQQGSVYEQEHRIVRPDGTVRVLLERARPQLDERGNAIKYVGAALDITERKQIEAKLRASEERFRALVTATSDVVYRMNPDWTHMHHLEGQGSIADTVSPDDDWLHKYIHPEDQPRVLAAITLAIRDKSVFELEHRVIRVDGSPGWTLSRAVPILDGNGKIIEWFGAATDVTARRRDEARLRRFFETDLFAVLHWKIDGGVVDVNEQFLKLTGYSREDLHAGLLNWAEITPEEYQALDEDARRQVRETGVHRPYEKQFIRKDGARVWGNFSAAAFDDDRTEGISLILDVTERKQAEAALQRSEERLRTVVSSIQSCLLLVTEDDHVALANQAFCDYFNLPRKPSDLAGLTAREMVESIQRTYARSEEQIARIGEIVRQQALVLGEEVDMQDGRSCLRDFIPISFNGSSFGRLWMHTDITGRKRAEAALAQAKLEVEQKNQELERRVAERTDNLQQMLAEMEQFTYVASHDLQEPLRSVSSFSQLLAQRYQGKLDADADEFITFVVEAAKRMQNLINDLLALSRIGTRGNPFAPVGGDQILLAATENLTVAIEESGAQVTHDPLPELVADQTQLLQVFQNLIGNAIKFRRPGQAPQIHVSARRQNESWQLSVRDNGIGIDPQYFDRIFVVFQRLHTREAYSGTGIGLAICKKIVERHGGRLWVESAVGKGSTFQFTIPIPNQF
ncbi:MAG: PAS domain S-box protein [Verrucomicrobiota bacterium]|jgi:PAS domain S-box-containing protein